MPSFEENPLAAKRKYITLYLLLSTRFCPSGLNLELISAPFDSAHDNNLTGM